ncbi:helix-turn-helix domain-containing protein [Salipiger thiooxidans]|nr:helix-turn-helix transcriptional regulator [Salipiger thiooxidans]MCA0846065.1 helix-turn-helix domain-containing protein [Salipiger thiooxidans]
MAFLYKNGPMSTTFEAIGDRLRRLRSGAGQTQAEFAETLGTSLRSYKGYESGQRELPTSIILRLCEFSGVSPSWLLTGERDGLSPEALDAIRLSLRAGLEHLRAQTNISSTDAWADYLLLLTKLSEKQKHFISSEDAQAILMIGEKK